MDKTYAPIENKSQEKIKVENIDIVVTGPKEKPYYAIKYRKVGSNDDCIGYGSYLDVSGNAQSRAGRITCIRTDQRTESEETCKASGEEIRCQCL